MFARLIFLKFIASFLAVQAILLLGSPQSQAQIALPAKLSGADLDNLVILRSKIEQLKDRLLPEHVAPADVSNIRPFASLIKSRLVEAAQLKQLTTFGALDAYLKSKSPVVAKSFCSDLGIDTTRCQELDCLTDPAESGPHSASEPRKCPYKFVDAEPMPLEPGELSKWMAQQLSKTTKKDALEKQKTVDAKRTVTLPVREDAVLLRQFLSENKALIEQRWNDIGKTLAQSPEAFADQLIEVVLKEAEIRKQIGSFQLIANDIKADVQLQTLLSPLTQEIDRLLERINASPALKTIVDSKDVIARSEATSNVPLSLSDEALADASFAMRAKIGEILTAKLAPTIQELNRWKAERDQVKLDAKQCNQSPDEGLVKVATGSKLTLYGVIEKELDQEQDRFRLHFMLGTPTLAFKGIANVTRKGATEQVKLHGDDACPAIGLIDLGIVVPSEWTTKNGIKTWRPRLIPGSLTIDVDEAKLLKALSVISPISTALEIQNPTVTLSDDLIGIDILASVKGLNAQFRSRITLSDGGILHDSTNYTAALMYSEAARSAVDALLVSRNRTIAISKAITVTDVRAIWPKSPGDAARFEELSFSGRVNLGTVGSFDVQLAVAKSDDGIWMLIPVANLPERASQNLLARLRSVGFLEKVFSGIDALKATAQQSASILQDALFIENCSISQKGELTFDLIIPLNGDRLEFRKLAFDPSNPDFAAVAASVTHAIATKYSQILFAYFQAKVAKQLVDAASAQFASLLQKLDKSEIKFFGIPATFHIEQAKRVRLEVRPSTSMPPVVISGLEVVDFVNGTSSPPIPKLSLAQVKISNQQELENYVASQLKTSARLPWISDNFKSKLKLDKDRISVVVTAKLPMVGDYQLPPISFDWSTGRLEIPEAQIVGGLKSAVVERLSKELVQRVQAVLPDDIRNIIGAMSLKLDGENLVVVAPFSFSSVRGRLEATLKFDNNTPKPDVKLIYDEASFADMLANAALGYLTSGKISIVSKSAEHPEVRVNIDGLPLADGMFNISVSNVGITPRGIEIDGVSVTIPGTIPIPPWILILRPRLGVFFKSKGFSLGGDITIDGIPILRIEADLQGLFATKTFKLDGTLVLFEFLRVFENKGSLELDQQLLKTHARTIGLLRVILPFDDISTIDAKAGTIEDSSSVNLLSLKMNTRAFISTKRQIIELTGDANLPVLAAGLHGKFASDLFLRSPEFRLGGSASLVGLNPSLDLSANTRSARLKMKVLGITVTVIAPGPSSLSTSFLEDIIRKLLKPSFDLNNLKKLDIVINLLPSSKDPDGPEAAAGASGPAGSNAAPGDAKGGVPTSNNSPAASASEPKSRPSAPPPKDSFVVNPFNGVYTGYANGYTSYRSLNYYCFSSWKIGDTAKPPCAGDVVSSEIATKLRDDKSRYLASPNARVRIPKCIDGTNCEDDTLEPTSDYELWLDPQDNVFTFASSHRGKPIVLNGSKILSELFGGNAASLIKNARQEERSYDAVIGLLSIEAQNRIMANKDGFTKSAAWSQTPQERKWVVWGTANNTSHEPNETILSLVDVKNDVLLTYNTSNGLAPFLEALASPGAQTNHPIKQVDLREFDVGGRRRVLWSDANRALLVLDGKSLAFVDQKKVDDEIAIDERSRFRSWFSTQAPQFPSNSITAVLANILQKDKNWDSVRIDEDASTAILTSKVGAKDWRIGLVAWIDQQQQNSQFLTISAADFGSRLQCWIKNGWIKEAAQKSLSDSEGKALSEALALDAPEYDKRGFRVDPRRLLDKCA